MECNPLETLCETIEFYIKQNEQNELFSTLNENSSIDEKNYVAQKLRKIFFTIRVCAEELRESELSYICVRYEKLSLDILHQKISFDEDVIELYENSVYILLAWKEKLCHNHLKDRLDDTLISFFNEKKAIKKDNTIFFELNCLIVSTYAQEIKELIELSNIQISQIFIATNGIDAVRLLQQNRIDILITQIFLSGLNGLVLAKKTYDKNNNAIIVYIASKNDTIPDFIKNMVVPYLKILNEPITAEKVIELFDDVNGLFNQKSKGVL